MNIAKKSLVKNTFLSIILFSVISYISVMFSLLTRTGGENPATNIGFPFKYYYQFWLSGSDSPNWGWDLKNFILDFLICWILVLFVCIKLKKYNIKNAIVLK